MARLILSLDGKVLAEYNMTKERYTIGRLPDNDVRVDNTAVSGHHSLIINILNDSFLEDLNSTNGTYVNGKLVKKHALQHGDVITIGQHQLRYVDDAHDEQADPDEFERTMIIRPGSAQQPNAPSLDTVNKAVASMDKNAAPIGAPQATRLPRGKLQVLSGKFAGKELVLTKALTTLGRPNIQVAAISRRSEGYFIIHVESGKAGDYPIVNGDPIGPQARALNDNDVIELANVKMGFFLVDD